MINLRSVAALVIVAEIISLRSEKKKASAEMQRPFFVGGV